MHSKYGDNTQPWDVSVKMPNVEGGVDGAWAENATHRNFGYKYGKKNQIKNEMVWERDPNRQLSI